MNNSYFYDNISELTDENDNIVIRDKSITDDIEYDKHIDGTLIKNFYIEYFLKTLPKKINGKNIIQLSERQIYNFNRLCYILIKYKKAIDSSPTGSGKTYNAICLAITLGLSQIIVISKKSILNPWKSLCDNEYYTPGIIFLSLDSINNKGFSDITVCKSSGSKLSKIKRICVMDNNEVSSTFSKYLNSCLVVFDEFHHGKRNNKTSNVYNTICSYIENETNNAYVLYTSATPTDKAIVNSTFYSLNFISNVSLVSGGNFGRDKNIEGLINFIRNTNRLDKVTNTKLLRDFFETSNYHNFSNENLSNVNVSDYLTECYNKIYKYYYTSYVSNKESSLVKNVNDKNLIPKVQYRLMKLNGDKGFDDILDKICLKIKTKLEESENNKILLSTFNNVIKIFTLINFENIIGLTLKELKKKRKVIIYIPDINHLIGDEHYNLIKEIKKEISNHYDGNILTLESEHNSDERNLIIKRFQKATHTYSVLVTSPLIGSTGISLDDTDGNFKRTVIALCSFNAINTSQILGRVFRNNTKSKAKIILPIPIGNHVPKNKEINDIIKFKSLKDYKEFFEINNFKVGNIGTKKIYNTHLNYIIAENNINKSEKINSFSTDYTNIKINEIPFIYYNNPIYPIEKNSFSDFFDTILSNYEFKL